tara:strand:- start:3070 stop:3255 length:186 start_codon:yes stop_codon:yes gene_type:complete
MARKNRLESIMGQITSKTPQLNLSKELISAEKSVVRNTQYMQNAPSKNEIECNNIFTAKSS